MRAGGYAVRKGFLLLLSLSLCGFLSHPQACLAIENILVRLDKTEATLEDQIILTVSITGKRNYSGTPELPHMPDFLVHQGKQSTQMQIISGQITASVDFTYLLTPKKAGDFTINPVKVRDKGRLYLSKPLRLRILPKSAAAKTAAIAFITQQADVKEAYVHQQIIYTFRFFRKVNAAEAQWDQPSFQGFWVEELGKEKQFEKIINGQKYLVTEIKKAIFPLSENCGDIPESMLTCRLVIPKKRAPRRGGFEDLFPRSFFGSRGQAVTKVLHAPPIPLKIRALPLADEPPELSGLVGNFQIQAEVGKVSLATGDSTTLTVAVSGEGNLRDLTSIPPETIPGFKIYPDKPSFQLQANGDRIQGIKIFKKALVPLVEGKIEIPEQSISFFDPLSHVYRTERTSPIQIMVEKSGQAEPLHLVQSTDSGRRKSSIEILGKDILPIHTGMSGARPHLPSGKSAYGYLLSLILPPFVFLICFVRKKTRDRLETDQHIIRRKKAYKKAKRILQEAKKGMDQKEDKVFFNMLSRSLKGLIGDKLDLSALACTPEEIHQCLENKGFHEETAKSIRDFLKELEYYQYVSTKTDHKEKATYYSQAEILAAKLAKGL